MWTAETSVESKALPDEDTAPFIVEHRLICVAGVDLGMVFRIGDQPVVIGRGRADVRLQSTGVSRRHARIYRAHATHFVEDLGSSNGTIVNGAPIRKPTPLAFGDRVHVGGTILVFARHDALEERLQQLQRLESMARVVGGLAHDFNNALMVISSHLDLFVGRFAGEDGEAIDDMVHATAAAARLSRRLLDLGRSEPAAFDTVSLAPLVDKTIAMARPALGEHITIESKISGEARVLGSEDELQQMMLNLFTNARDAMPDGGRLIVSARVTKIAPTEALVRHLQAADEYVEIVITDTGIGMDEATLARVFEPFFTTKPVGKGTGLGLMMVHTTVRRHGGVVSVRSVVGHGTEVRITFPSTPPAQPIG